MNEDLTMFRWEGENRLWNKIHEVIDEHIRSANIYIYFPVQMYCVVREARKDDSVIFVSCFERAQLRGNGAPLSPPGSATRFLSRNKIALHPQGPRNILTDFTHIDTYRYR